LVNFVEVHKSVYCPLLGGRERTFKQCELCAHYVIVLEDKGGRSLVVCTAEWKDESAAQ